MIDLSLMQTDGILKVTPTGPFTDSDMDELRAALSRLTAGGGEVKGLLIDARAFPGYADFNAFAAHLGVVRDFHGRIAKLALVSDALFASAAELVARNLLGVDARHFARGEAEAALAWLKE